VWECQTEKPKKIKALSRQLEVLVEEEALHFTGTTE